jgi:Hyaluronidase
MTPDNKSFATLTNESLETSQCLVSLTQQPAATTVVSAPGGDPGARRTRTQFLLGKGASLGFSALTLLTLAGCGVHRVVTMAPATAPATAAPTVPPTAPPTTPPAAQAKFLVFDATLYKTKPNLAQFGLTPISVEYPGVLWPATSPDMQNVPDATVVQKLAAGANQSAGLAVVDIEQWSVVGDPATVAESVAKYQQTLQMFQQDAPSLQFGYYAIAPIRNYWDVMAGPQSAGYLAWQQENDAVAPIAQQADALFPSLYTFYTDQAGWKKYAIANIAEARRIAPGKPVYVFLWPQYDASTGAQGGDYLPDAYWQMELETAKQYADGVVIWGGWTETWDNNAS